MLLVYVRVTLYNVAGIRVCTLCVVSMYIHTEPVYVYGCTYIHTCIRSYRCIVLYMKMYGHYGL